MKATATWVGREAELRELAALLERAPLVTVVGPVGVGKTSLVRRLLSGAGRERRGVVGRFVDLSEAVSAEQAIAAIAASAGVQLPPRVSGAGAAAALAAALAARAEPLLVLDNFEQLAAQAQSVLGTLREATRLVVTSRVALGLDAEALFELGPLPEEKAGELFAARARLVRRSFRPGDARVREVVRLLDGLPLAIELIAARCGVLSLEQLRALLPGQVRELASGGTGRHGTLRAAVDASWRLLSDTERWALAQISVFRGGFELGAAEAVLQLERAAVLDVLAALHRQSLLRAESPSGGPMRYGLYLGIRELAADHLADAEAQALRRRHAEHCARAEAREVELDNLRAAFAWAVESGSALAAGLSLKLFSLQSARGPFAGLVEVLAKAIETAEPSADRLECMLAYGTALRSWGRNADSERAFQRALGEAAEDPVAQGRARGSLAILHHARGDLRVALAEAERGVALLEGADPASRGPHVGWAYCILGFLLIELERHGEAQQMIQRASALLRGHAQHEPFAVVYRGHLSLDQGRLAEAHAYYSRAVKLAQRSGHLRAESYARLCRGMAALERRAPKAALADLDAALSGLEAIGDERAEACALAARGAARASMGDDLEAAAADFDRAFERVRGVGEAPLGHLVTVLHGVLELAFSAQAADTEAAARHVGLARRAAEPATNVAQLSSDVRWGQRVLDGALSRAARRQPAPRPLARGLKVASDGSWFQAPQGRRVSLERRKVARRLLLALAEARVSAPGRGLSADELIAVGWPGEKIMPLAAPNRLHVALSELRKLGLKAQLKHGERGHLLDPSVPLVFASPRAPKARG